MKYRYIDKLPKNVATLSDEEYMFLAEYVKERGYATCLEFGPGVSTWALLDGGCEVIVTLEYENNWLARAFEVFGSVPEVEVHGFENVPEIDVPSVNGLRFDMAFVDSPSFLTCKHLNRLNTCEFAAKHTDAILLHDATRSYEVLTQKVFEEKGWDVELVLPSDAERGISLIRRSR